MALHLLVCVGYGITGLSLDVLQDQIEHLKILATLTIVGCIITALFLYSIISAYPDCLFNMKFDDANGVIRSDRATIMTCFVVYLAPGFGAVVFGTVMYFVKTTDQLVPTSRWFAFVIGICLLGVALAANVLDYMLSGYRQDVSNGTFEGKAKVDEKRK